MYNIIRGEEFMDKLKFLILLVALGITIFITSGCKGNKDPEAYEFSEENVIVANGNFSLDGKICLPETDDKVAAVVIVGGSGPIDMDGSVNAQKPYLELAKKLAVKGIASLRYNKVTQQFNSDIAKDYDFTIEDEYIYAIENAVAILKNDERIDSSKIYLIGHSLGAQIIPVVLNKDQSLAGGILMAGTTMHILDLILEQVKRQDENKYNEYRPYVEYAKSLTEVPNGEEQYFYFGAYTAYYVSYNNINRNIVKDLNCRLLIMQGELDLQISIDHFNNYKALLKGNENVTYKQYPLLNHLFSNGEGENINTAYKVKKPIDDEVINDIYNFIIG